MVDKQKLVILPTGLSVNTNDNVAMNLDPSGVKFTKPVSLDSIADVSHGVKFNDGDFDYDPVSRTLTVTNLVVRGAITINGLSDTTTKTTSTVKKRTVSFSE